jgi:ribulose-phosphate 3-epimerase
MCCDFFDFKDTIRLFEEENIEYLHIDVMDGFFVPNFTLGTDFVKQLKAKTRIPLDLHFMIEEPERKLDYFTFGEGDIVSVHAESTKHLQLVLRKIKDRGAKAYVAINPATPICVLEEVIDDLDGVLVMTVNPGFAGQKLIPSTLRKISKVREFLDENGKAESPIEVDGNVSFENAKLMNQSGADIFVAGTSSVFKGVLLDGIRTLREVIKD